MQSHCAAQEIGKRLGKAVGKSQNQGQTMWPMSWAPASLWTPDKKKESLSLYKAESMY